MAESRNGTKKTVLNSLMKELKTITRHVSHLVGLFPGTLFGKDQPEYLEAARATLNHRGDGGTGWSKANKINLWARLLDGNRAHRLLAEQLKSSNSRKPLGYARAFPN